MNYVETKEGAAHLSAFLETVGPTSRRVYRSEVVQFFKGFEGEPAAIGQDDLSAWRERMGPAVADKTVKRKVSILNRFFGFMAGRLDGFRNPFVETPESLERLRAAAYPGSDAFRRDLSAWLDKTPGINAESTRRIYANHLSLFFRWAGKPPGDVTAEDMERYRDHLRERGLKPATIWTRFIALNGFFQNLAIRHERFRSPLDFKAMGLDVPDPETGYYNTLTKEEVCRLYQAPDRGTPKGKRDYLILRLLLVYGLRVGEVAKLRMEDADRERIKGKLRVWVRDRKGRKNRRESTPIILEGEELRAWDDWIDSSGIDFQPRTPIIAPFRHVMKKGVVLDFRRLETNRPRTTAAIRNVVAECMETAGIKIHDRRLSPHALRHTCFTFLARAGVNIVDIKKLAAHKDISTTMIYMHAAQSFDDHIGMKNPLAGL
jgi:site-specific recombinase XerD